ncbi:MAG: hypothetical protein R3C24_06560 [Cyanobacteriota/Melainabacteria group bacterium]
MGTSGRKKKTKTDTASLFELLGIERGKEESKREKTSLRSRPPGQRRARADSKNSSLPEELKNRDAYPLDLLQGKHLALTFCKNSTRTRTSFSIAATNLGANSVGLDISTSSRLKGESLKDTALTLGAMGVEALVIRRIGSSSRKPG